MSSRRCEPNLRADKNDESRGECSGGNRVGLSGLPPMAAVAQGRGIADHGAHGPYDPHDYISGLRSGSDSRELTRQRPAPRHRSMPAWWSMARVPPDAGPLRGLLISQDQIPGNIQSAGRQQPDESGALSIGDFMSSQLQGVSTNDYSGNPFQMDVNYRGFTASPEIGTPEGLSVFFDGIRVNEPFGDVVNWDSCCR